MSAANCEEVTDLLEPFIDGELAEGERKTVAQHVGDCAACQRQLEELVALRDKLRRISPLRAPAGLAVRIGEKLAEAQSSSTESPGWRVWTMPVASHLAAGLAGLALGYWIMLADTRFEGRSRELIGAHVRSLMAARPIDVASGDPHRVAPWFAGKLDFAPKVRDLSAQGFPLLGARADYFDGSRVAAIVYRRREHAINVFMMPHRSGSLRQREFRRNGYNVVGWSDGEYDFWAVSDLNRRELGELATLLGAA